MNLAHISISLIPVSPSTVTYTPQRSIPSIQVRPPDIPPIPLNNVSEKLQPTPGDDILAAAVALFPAKSSMDSSFKTRAASDPSLDHELDWLKKSFLSHSEFGSIFRKSSCVSQPDCNIDSGISVSPLPRLPPLHVTPVNSPKFTLPPPLYTKPPSPKVEKMVGGYTVSERQRRIKKYKDKLKKWRAEHPVSRKFDGRRKVAFIKYRLNGRFAKAK